MVILFGISFATYFSLITLHRSLSKTYFSLEANWLVVQVSSGSGEIHGSRLKSGTGQILVANGYDNPIPEIHQIVGTSLSNGIMIRGVKPEDLYKVSPFDLLEGRSLVPGDGDRLAMIGINLANRLRVGVGEIIKLRGREFTVIGIFKTGSYEDSQAWITLLDAQKLLNYGSDVSIYYIPDDGSFREGDNIAQGVMVGRRGDAGNSFGNEVMSFFRFLGLIGSLTGIAFVVTVTNLLWRLTWLHRREFGILRTLGFPKRSVLVYVLTQAMVIFLAGALIGGFFSISVVLSHIKDFSSFGIILAPTWDIYTLGLIVVVTLIIAGIGVLIPSKRIYTISTIDLLGRE